MKCSMQQILKLNVLYQPSLDRLLALHSDLLPLPASCDYIVIQVTHIITHIYIYECMFVCMYIYVICT